MFGLTVHDLELYEQWTADALAVAFAPPGGYVETAEETRRRAASMVGLDGYLSSLIAERRVAGDDGDFLSSLVGASADGPMLTDPELKGTLCLILLAGTNTTSNLIAHMLMLLIGDRSRWDEVRDDRALIPAVVEEALRLSGPSHGVYRVATRDVELGGVTIPAGDGVFVSLSSANHDEATFERPEEYRLDRLNANQHVAFGRGVHHCLGATLGRNMSAMALEEILGRFSRLSLVPDQQIEWTDSPIQPKLKGVRVRVDANVSRTD
jgi:cytochrome P450